jgi:Papain fold toxin 2
MKDELRQQIAVIANCFHLFECVECAAAIQQFLIAQNIPGKSISLFTGSTKEPFCHIYHNRLQENISTNGRHQAIAVEIDGQELIFDNIHPAGISRVEWSENLYCPFRTWVLISRSQKLSFEERTHA